MRKRHRKGVLEGALFLQILLVEGKSLNYSGSTSRFCHSNEITGLADMQIPIHWKLLRRNKIFYVLYKHEVPLKLSMRKARDLPPPPPPPTRAGTYITAPACRRPYQDS